MEEAEKGRCWLREEERSHGATTCVCTAFYPEQILLTNEWWTLAAQNGQLNDTCVESFSELLKGKLPN